MYRELVTDEVTEIYRAFEDAVRRTEQGERLRLELYKERDCYTLKASEISGGNNPQTDVLLVAPECM